MSTSSERTAEYSEDSSNALLSNVDYAGWQISSSSSSNSDQVKLVSAIKVNLERKDLPDFVKRILIHAYAGAPAKVGECISKYGHVPYFLRWSPGKATLQGETPDSDLKTGKIAWKIAGNGRGMETQDGQQIAWLQYSSTMYRKRFRIETVGAGLKY